ncbi:hypothetical protein DDZ18_01290 [Marinicauda salina]|uniref:Tryptophan-rich sensory protein n=1 Tax=Marinicauda salina TaxID=2135793 RepID=A0A2U2BW75_9PROT|nr:TspO/MBR family protein [Marinicauda salina]PWE18271.1 hypothetical protein DDZ18_01290 [Marinicauda salina]
MATNIFRRPRAGAARLLIYILIFTGIAVALNGWIFSGGAIAWSRGLAQPGWAPGGVVIGSVWVGLFGLMAAALWFVDRSDDPARKGPARALILLQYLVSVSWTGLYFGLQSVAAGFWTTIVATLLCVVATWAAFRASTAAGVLLVPLLAWLGFAVALAWSVWRLNA